MENREPEENQGRVGDGVLVVVQDNAQRALTIAAVNGEIEALLGYGSGALLNASLPSILGKTVAETVAESLEYEENGVDFGDIFSRIRNITLRHRDGHDVPVTMTLTRLMAQGRQARFQLVVPNEHEQTKSIQLREFIALNLEGRKELDAATGLPNHKTAKEFLPLLKNYLRDAGAGVVFAVLRVDRFDKSVARYGKKQCADLLKHAAQLCRTTFRSQDLVFALGENTLGLVLFDLSRESARVVLNRFRWKVKSQRFDFGGKSDFSISISIGFDMLDLEHADDAFDRCESAVVALDAAERNALIELEAA